MPVSTSRIFGPTVALLCLSLLVGCGDGSEAGDDAMLHVQSDLPIGSVAGDKGDGHWGHATECKPIPYVEPLVEPKIVISLDGLTLHLTDEAGDYDRVFPIGVGAMEAGESLTPVSTGFYSGSYYTRTDEAPTIDGPTPDEARWGWNHQCRMWWTSSETGEKMPVFAGLPFIRLAGHPTSAAYGIHGPVDRFYREDGGVLRRGYVSHGCVRMAADDIVEVWGRLQGVRAEVIIQTAVERLPDGTAIDADNWLLSDCQSDADCAFDGGFCKRNTYEGRGFCTRRCERSCPDKAGHPVSFCVPDEDGEGYCTVKSDETLNGSCARYAGFLEKQEVSRPDGSAAADVCVPGSEGWIGDGCLSDDECSTGLCTPIDGGPRGICTEPCDRFCPDREGGFAGTFCAPAPSSVPEDGGMCVARCSSDSDCVVGTTCRAIGRYGQSGLVRRTCLP